MAATSPLVGLRGPPNTLVRGWQEPSLCCRYKEEDLRLASRAGHSAMLLHDPGGYRLVVFGGRDSCDVEVAGRWSKTKIHVSG